jgi:ATP-dependent helicase HrpA
MPFAHGDFIEALTRALREATNIFVAREHWHTHRLPRHLVMNIRVIDPRKHGKVVMSGRDLAQIRREFAGQAEQSLVRLPEGPWNRSGVYHWDFAPIPEEDGITHDGRTITVFPALNDEGGSEDVSIRPFADRAKAAAAHAAGLRRLFFLHTRRECRSLIETTPGIEKLKLLHAALAAAPYVSDSRRGIVEDLAELTAHRAWDEPNATDVRTKDAFEARLNRSWLRIGLGGAEVFKLGEGILREHMALAAALREAEDRPEWGAAMLDLRVQLAYLFSTSFWTRTPWEWLRQYPRYLGSIRRRLERLGGIDGLARDTRFINEIGPWVTKLRIRVEQGTPSERSDPNLILFRWMLEEFRIALWGDAGGRQETVLPVSSRRLEEQWLKVTAHRPSE